MSNGDYIQRGIVPGCVRAEIGGRSWELLTRASETYPPQSIAVEIKHGNYVYHGTAYLVDSGEEAAQPARVISPSQQPPQAEQQEQAGGQQ